MSDAYTFFAHPGSVEPIEARLTAPEPPGGAGAAERGALAYALHFLGLAPSDEVRVDHETALTYSAVWGCVRAIVQGLAPLGWHTFDLSPDGRERVPVEDPTAWILDLQANPEMSAMAWREVMLKDALTCGDAYSEIERTGLGKPNWLWPLSPGRVTPFRSDAGELLYDVDNGPGAKSKVLAPRDVFHLKGISPDGVVGYDTIGLMRRAIKLGLQEERYGSQSFGKGTMPGGFLEVPNKLSAEQQRELRRSFEAMYSGQENAGRIAILHGGTKFLPGQSPNDAAQFLEARRFQVSEVCRYFGVPPHKLADLERATFSNIEEQEIAFVRDCLLPWARRLETEADIKLFGPVKRGRRFTKLNLDALMRGNSSTQTSTITAKVTSGLMTVNEGRGYFDLNPIEGGDTALIQGAMARLEDVVSPPEPEPAVAPAPAAPPVAPPVAPPPEPGAAPAQALGRALHAARVFGALAEGVFVRALHVEEDKARRALNKGRLAAHVAEFYPAHAREVAAWLRPVMEGLALAVGAAPERGAGLAAVLADEHVARSRAELAAAPEEALAAWAGGRAREQAAAALGALSRKGAGRE